MAWTFLWKRPWILAIFGLVVLDFPPGIFAAASRENMRQALTEENNAHGGGEPEVDNDSN